MSEDTPAADLPTNEQLINFHPVYDAPSPAIRTARADLKPFEPTLGGLPPEMRARVEARLVDASPASRQQLEARYIEEELLNNAVNVRVMGGLGPDATPVQREVFEIANEHRLMLDEHARLTRELEEVVRYDTRENPETGEPEPVPVYRVQGDRQTAYEGRVRELERLMRVLNEIDKPKRLAAACDKTRAQMQQVRDQLAERAEAKVVAEKMLREQRVQHIADGIVKSRRDSLMPAPK